VNGQRDRQTDELIRVELGNLSVPPGKFNLETFKM